MKNQMLNILWSAVLLVLCTTGSVANETSVPLMSQQQMEAIVKDIASQAAGANGFVSFVYQDVPMTLLSDNVHNRMRIIAAVADYNTLSKEQLNAVMESNFHKALDARYAVSDNILYAAFIHPMEELTEWQIKSAVYQVANLVKSFGTEYSSGALQFGRNRQST